MTDNNSHASPSANAKTTSPVKQCASTKINKKAKPYMQNRELSWLEFNKRVLDQAIDPEVPYLERLKFIAIWRSNLQEFFMVRVGSLCDLELAKGTIVDSKTGMTPSEQLEHVYARVEELMPQASEDFRSVRHSLEKEGIFQLYPDELTEKQHKQLFDYLDSNILPLVSPQIINATHPFPHLENGALYIIVRLDDVKGTGKKKHAQSADDVIMGIIPMPHNCPRMIPLDSEDGTYSFILLEHALELATPQIFAMYPVKGVNVVQVTRNADLDTSEESDENDEDFRSHMKRILKKRRRLSPVRLESERPLSEETSQFLMERLELTRKQTYVAGMPLDMGYAFGLPSVLPKDMTEHLIDTPAHPQWPACLDRNHSIMQQVQEKDVILSYPYESMDPFVRMLQEAATDPEVISIKITLYRLASKSRLAEALISAAENGKEVTALFELRARFDESNNIEWSQRFEQAGCNIIYGFRDYKVHSKICAITRRTPKGLQFITQLGTGNYNEKTAALYTDFSMITADTRIGMDAARFFQNMQLESIADSYNTLWVAPLMIKQNLCKEIDEEIRRANEGLPANIVMKANSVTDKDIIEKLQEASKAGVKITMLIRGISCLVPGIEGCTENIRVVSVVGRLLEHSRIYVFGTREENRIYLSSADLMTRNLDKRVEIAWPVSDPDLKKTITDYLDTMLADTAKLRELKPDGTFTDLGYFGTSDDKDGDIKLFDAQDYLIKKAYIAAEKATKHPKTIITATMSDFAEEAKEDIIVIPQAEEPAESAPAEAPAETSAAETPAETPTTEVSAKTQPEAEALTPAEEVPTTSVPTPKTVVNPAPQKRGFFNRLFNR